LRCPPSVPPFRAATLVWRRLFLALDLLERQLEQRRRG
jgi:hypothetical protein